MKETLGKNKKEKKKKHFPYNRLIGPFLLEENMDGD